MVGASHPVVASYKDTVYDFYYVLRMSHTRQSRCHRFDSMSFFLAMLVFESVANLKLVEYVECEIKV